MQASFLSDPVCGMVFISALLLPPPPKETINPNNGNKQLSEQRKYALT